MSQLSGRCSATVKIVVIRSTATVIAKRVRRAGASKRRERCYRLRRAGQKNGRNNSGLAKGHHS
ncbi:MAG: hypothetical protein ACON5I_13000 [Verrucomicrobiales bacterium]